MSVGSTQPITEAAAAGVAQARTPGSPAANRHRWGGGIRGREGAAGWLFVSPVVVILSLFLVIPVIVAIWVSVSDWSGKGSPLTGGYVGLQNYQALLTKPGLAQRNLGISLRNNFYYVVLVVPLQTILALFLASVLNVRRLRGQELLPDGVLLPVGDQHGGHRHPVPVPVRRHRGRQQGSLLVRHQRSQLVRRSPRGADPRSCRASGLVDPTNPPDWMTHTFMGVTWQQWLAGPSVAMCVLIILAVWTTGGTFMLLFLAAMQDIPADVVEAATVDGATRWQIFRKVTLPSLRPTLFLVITLGLIGTWQVFDAVYLTGQGKPANTTLTPAFLSYATSFTDGKWGQGAAISFILFAIIILMTLIQRLVMRERKTLPKRRRYLTGQPS